MIRNLASIINGASDKSLINDFKSALKLCRCPRCNSYKVVRNGTYKRRFDYYYYLEFHISICDLLCDIFLNI